MDEQYYARMLDVLVQLVSQKRSFFFVFSCLPSTFFQISPNWGLATMQSVLASVKIYRSIDVEIHRSFSSKLAVLLNREQLISQLWTET